MNAVPTHPVLRIEDLAVSYGGKPALHGVDLVVEPGETVAVVGASGSGKSTTAHAAIGLLPRGATVDRGRVRLGAEDVVGASDRTLARLRGSAVGFVPQDPTVSLDPVQTVGAQIAEALRVHRRAPREQTRRRVLEILARVGIDRPGLRATQYPHELSGGQRQRVLIGIATANEPRLVIADEATSGLDVTVQRRVLDQLEALTREQGAGVLLITHDLGVASDRADRVVVLEAGRIVEQGPTDQVLGAPSHAYTRRLFDSAPSLAATTAAARTAERELERTTPRPLLEVRGLARTFTTRSAVGGPREITAVDGVDLDVPTGRTFALVGESGSGKTTTARIVAGFERASAGSVVLHPRGDGGQVLTPDGREARRAFRRRVQFVHQNPFASLDPRFAVAEIIAEPLRSFRIGTKAERRARVLELLDAVHLPAEVAARRPTELSGGQRQRVAIARALALRPDLVILDEAVSALDVLVQRQVLDVLDELQRESGVSYLFITHDLAVVRLVAHEVGVLRNGRIVERGSVDRVFDAPEHEYTAELLRAIPGTRVRSPRPH
ncbi:dipeptide ABC transporter ATP-binding protein [Curtobacterium pusillum]|uniref:dipeptide ABC transporter ATP-binding protein n=1 Tax=Curtobacterium pusillum TaxID=69373 RepID=UPI00381FD1A5